MKIILKTQRLAKGKAWKAQIIKCNVSVQVDFTDILESTEHEHDYWVKPDNSAQLQNAKLKKIKCPQTFS